MRIHFSSPQFFVTVLLALTSPAMSAEEPDLAQQPSPDSVTQLPTISIVTGQRQAVNDQPASSSVISREDIERINHSHPTELFSRSPGIWVTRGSGQEHLTAIRSPVLTGAGACGAFLFMEDGVPIRPSGFCNVNNLFEINLLQASGVEIMRGPGNALYGSNAQHGLINAVSSRPFDETSDSVGLDLGSHDFYRLRIDIGDAGERQAWRVKAHATDSGSFRQQEGYNQQKLNIAHDRLTESGEWTTRLALTRLDQQTAGFILGEDAYRDELRFANLNPEAFRRADAQRLILGWQAPPSDSPHWQAKAWLRNSDMRFRMHFLPGKPLEENDQQSIGASLSRSARIGWGEWLVGMDIEYARAGLLQLQR